jgi:hypothetical protein
VKRLAAPLLDVVCVVIFVLVGVHTHGMSGGVVTFLVILWPLLLGWATLATLTGLYTRRPDRAWVRVGVTWVAGLALGLLLRGAVTSRPLTPGFVAVTFGFIGAATIGWRAMAVLLARIPRPAVEQPRPEPGDTG